MMLKSVERLLEFVGDMNATEINDHIKARPDGIAVSFRIDDEWLDGWNRAVLATVEKIEQEVSERYMELPKDADGVPYRIGDKVDSDYYENGTVIGIHYFKAPNGVVFEEIAVQPNEWDTATWRDPDDYTHHHEPTVEDVLREMCLEIDRRCERGSIDYDELFAEYAAKLRLAKEGE